MRNINGIVFLVMILLGGLSCSDKNVKEFELKNNCEGQLYGMYQVEVEDGVYDNFDSQVWIFDGDIHYIIYLNPTESGLTWFRPTHYFIEQDRFVKCGLKGNGIMPFEECKNSVDGYYEIVYMDETVDEFGQPIHLIRLRRPETNRYTLKLTKILEYY